MRACNCSSVSFPAAARASRRALFHSLG
ncbi:hypothetical protein [Pseudoflavonifractor capillosus]